MSLSPRKLLPVLAFAALAGCGSPNAKKDVQPKPPVSFTQVQAHALAEDEPKQVVKTLFPFLHIAKGDAQTIIPARQGGVYVAIWHPGCDDNGPYNCEDDTLSHVDYYHR